MRRFMVLARPALADAGFMDPRSTYKGECKPRGTGQEATAARGVPWSVQGGWGVRGD